MHDDLTFRCSRRQALHLLAISALAASLPGVALAGAYDDYFTAVKLDNVKLVRSLLQRGFDPNTVEEERGETGLIIAVREDASKVFELLLNTKEVNLDARARNGDSALMIAAYKGKYDAVKTLLDRGAEPNQTGWAALHYAAAIGSNPIVQLLLDRSAYIDAESPNQTTPIMMAARGGHILTVKLLLDEGADLTLKNGAGMTALDFARAGGFKDIVEGLTYRLKKAGKL
ncbi:ankyrin repeat domain-containing protein|uniref:ankyrin repeat domain-containing protein n=1 Tax=Noviherbaspirillum sp. L7-7A TaxID=2850560 RepID=UPI001C2C3104|nr:ankyrin repeat domain-containing protein [Noviherbaspirillum sp. L7-7A]MBV0878809.1 ankyrin repeat domain-containing protein [Noviherbaspirillum sp. L7-7A]